MNAKHKSGKLIQQKISEIQRYEDDIPGVIILHNSMDGSVEYMSKRGREFLGVTLDELKAMGPEYLTRFFNPEEARDYSPKLLEFLQRQDENEIISLFQQVRRSPEHNYSWFMSGMKIILKDSNKNPLLIMTIAIPVDTMHELAQKAQRVLDENNFLKKNYHLFETLSRREQELLKLFAKGATNESIAKQLFISEETVATHRKNIKRKLNCKTSYDCTYIAQAFNLI
jgi:hypothetical protein